MVGVRFSAALRLGCRASRFLAPLTSISNEGSFLRFLFGSVKVLDQGRSIPRHGPDQIDCVYAMWGRP